MKFIKTSDENTANLLREAGFQEITMEGNRWVFINEPDKLNFSADETKNMEQSNILCF